MSKYVPKLSYYFIDEIHPESNEKDTVFDGLANSVVAIMKLQRTLSSEEFYKFINKVKKLRNNFLSFLVVNNKRHNPTYTLESVKYKDKIMDEYWKRLNKHKFCSDQERLDYFKDVSIK